MYLQATKAIADLLHKLWEIHNERQKERFEKVFRPVFENLCEVHSDYIEIFLSLAGQIPSSYQDDPEHKEDAEFEVNLINEIRSDLRLRRKANRGHRDGLREDSLQLLASCKNPLEKTFIVSVLLYFLENESSRNSTREFGWLADSVESKGSDQLRTPSEAVESNLREATSLYDCYKILIKALNETNLRYAKISGEFSRLKNGIYT